jgi:CelD/BcsL family acetyltransferase involved in cellulose biosynthesis
MSPDAPRRPIPERTAVSIELVRGERALDRLDDARFVAEWDRLHAGCPWASSFQSFAFVDCWYRLHDELFEPVVVQGRDEDGTLTGLLTLARRRTGRTLVGAGDIHAEYQGWIADDEGSDRFMNSALDRLEQEFPRGHLRFRYLPPGTPVEWARESASWPRRVRVVARTRGTIDLSDPAAIEASLRKGHNRSRLNGLRRYGDVYLETLDGADALAAEIDEIAIMCDLRQGAVNDSLPFTNNPRKRPFHLELMARGLLHATILRVDGRIASAHLDIKGRDEVLIYLIAHDPALARQSPGSHHILMLARDLAEAGVARYDLSPGVGYKERFATQQDTVHRMAAEFGFSERLAADVQHRGVTLGTRVLAATGRTPHGAMLEADRMRTRLANRVTRRRRQPSGEGRSTLLGLPGSTGRPADGQPSSLSLDRIGDLLTYEVARSTDLSIHRFLELAMHRLGVGHRPLTLVEDGTLVECWWLARTDVVSKGAAARDLSSAASLVLYDPILAAGSDDMSIADRMEQLRTTIDALAPNATTTVVVPEAMTAIVDALVVQGATRVADLDPLEPAPSPPAGADTVMTVVRAGWPTEHRDGS